MKLRTVGIWLTTISICTLGSAAVVAVPLWHTNSHSDVLPGNSVAYLLGIVFGCCGFLASLILSPVTVKSDKLIREHREKPKKRLVSKGRYAWLMAGRATLLSVSVTASILGLTAFGLSLLMVCVSFMWGFNGIGYLWSVGFACVAVGLFFVAFRSFKAEQRIERVTPLTPQRAFHLPPEETLLRAADLPPSQYPAELLRAAGKSPETPAEHLLRATEEKGT